MSKCSICLKARIVRLLYRQFSNVSSHTIVTLYTSLVRLRLEYACPVWSSHLAKDINLEFHWELGISVVISY